MKLKDIYLDKKSIQLVFTILLMLMLYQSALIADTFDEERSGISDPEVVHIPILYHENGKLCWKDPHVYCTSSSYNDAGIVYYSNGKLCWKDPHIYNTSSSYNNSGIVYYSSGELCWKDPDVYNTSSSYNNSGIVYYSNGELCWKDPNVYNTSYSYNNSGIVYYFNGQLCWKDPNVYNTSSSYNNSGIIYHTNGQICWKDPSIYSDGGKCFDSKGKFIAFYGLSNFMSLALDSTSSVQIRRDGQFKLTIKMGDGNYLIRSYDETTALIQSLGSSLHLYVPCQESPKKSIWIFDDNNNWMNISEKEV